MLRAATTFLMVFGLILSGGFFWVLQARPHTQDKLQLERYSVVLGGYLILTIICFLGAALCAILLVRKVREEYRAETRNNLEMLVETTLHSHQKKPTSND